MTVEISTIISVFTHTCCPIAHILSKLDKLQEKKNTLMQEYSSTKSTMDELYKIRKNYGIYMGKEMKR